MPWPMNWPADKIDMQPIAHIHNAFKSKFGIPRQAGLVAHMQSCIVFEPPYRQEEAFRGLEGFSHIWLLWDFSESHSATWHPTVRPPRLGGNRRMGVFATRSPFRPNPIGLSAVRLTAIRLRTPQGPVLYVEGADLMDGTPIYDIKPYLPFTDSHPEATGGFTEQTNAIPPLAVDDSSGDLSVFTPHERQVICDLIAQDPRPHYQDDSTRIYIMPYAQSEIHFHVEDGKARIIKVQQSMIPNP